MKKLAIILTPVIYCAIFLTGCAPSSAATGPINPGDKSGNFLITTGDADSVSNAWGLNCPDEAATENYHCSSNVGKRLNVSNGIFASGATDIETMWAEHTHEVLINGRPVNLEAFGWLDAVHPHVGEMRYWNVVILASAPGEVTVRNSGVVDGDAFDSTATISFSVP